MRLRLFAAFLAWHLAALAAVAALSCATVPAPVKACTANLTDNLVASAAAALAEDDYQGAIERAFAGVAACLVTAAVDAAIDQAKTIKFSGDRAAGVNSVIQLHGQAWLAARGLPSH